MMRASRTEGFEIMDDDTDSVLSSGDSTLNNKKHGMSGNNWRNMKTSEKVPVGNSAQTNGYTNITLE